MAVTPRGMSIQEAYREFREDNFIVNRNYQRKLVWTQLEKQKLIDSLIHGYPVPLFLFATKVVSAAKKEYEILDGMQRLEAIFGFIENQFDFDGKFFDVGELSRANQLAEQGLITVNEDPSKKLSPEICADLLDYTLAITEYPGQDQKSLTEIFGRINAYGKQLSDQEKRQAGILSPFAVLIRELACELRGDSSADVLNLRDMASISINLDKKIDGINADETFWCKNGILRKQQLRDGEDEQLLADIAVSIIENKPFAFSGDNLDKYYDPSKPEYSEVSEKVLALGKEVIKNDIISVISIIRETFNLDSGTTLQQVLHPESGSNPIKTAFYSLFMSFYELCVLEEHSPDDNRKIIAALKGVHSKLNIAAGSIKSDSRRQNIDVFKGLITPYFVNRTPPSIQSGPGLSIRLENTIRRSKIETSAYECKQGIISLESTRKVNADVYEKIVKTICGIANIGPNSEGALLVGVADKEQDKVRIEQLDSISAIQVGNRFVVGIERECKVLGCSVDDYVRRLVGEINKSKLSEPLKTSTLSNIHVISFRGLTVLYLYVPRQKGFAMVDDVIFTREGSETREIHAAPKVKAVMDIFA